VVTTRELPVRPSPPPGVCASASLCSIQLPCQCGNAMVVLRVGEEDKSQSPFFYLGVRMHPCSSRAPYLAAPSLSMPPDLHLHERRQMGSPPVHVMTLHVSPAPRPAMAACCSHVTVTPGWDASRMHVASDTHCSLSLALFFSWRSSSSSLFV